MQRAISNPLPEFTRTIRSYQKGAINYQTLKTEVDRQLAAGVDPNALLEALRYRQLLEPLESPVKVALSLHIEHTVKGAAIKRLVGKEPVTVVIHGSGAKVPSDGDPARASTVKVNDFLQGRFRLVELIGEGGMSCVYKAIDLRRVESEAHDPYVAVKILRNPFDEHFESIAALQREAQKLQTLAHPNIVRVFDCDRDGQTVFMTMEYLEGGSLYKLQLLRTPGGSRGPPLGAPAARSIILAVASALQYAHQSHIVHGDLKPGNIFMTSGGETKVIDFGIARWINRPKTPLERREAAHSPNVSVITPRYASPQVLARQRPEISDDVYALSCLAYELLTGVHPFESSEGVRTLTFPPVRLAGMSAIQYGAIVHGLQLDRRSRTTSAQQFIDEFSNAPSRPFYPNWRWPVSALVLAAAVGGTWLALRTPDPLAHAAIAPKALPTTTAPRSALPGTVIRDCPTCLLMTVIAPGQYHQGSPADGTSLPFEQPRHLVTINHVFALSTNEVTVADYQQFVASTGRDMQGCATYTGLWRFDASANWQNPGFAQTTAHPVTCVSWNDAIAFADWYSTKTKQRYRLPSASEWEYAAGSADSHYKSWQSGGSACVEANVADQNAARLYPGWAVFACSDGFAHTAPVGSFKANVFGLNDMLGNVLEWTADCWNPDYSGAPADGRARESENCTQRELRGGSWFSSPRYVRAAYRDHFAANYRATSIGFRLAKDLVP